MFDYGNRSSSPLEPQLPELLQSKMSMPPPTPRSSARQQPGHPSTAGRRSPFLPTATVPMRIPTVSAASMMAQQGGSNSRRARRGIQITISAASTSTSALPARRERSSSSRSAARPTSVYGKNGAGRGAYHSFTVCTAEDCEVCNYTGDGDGGDRAAASDSASRRQGSFFLHENNTLPVTSESDRTCMVGNGGKEDSGIKAHRRRRLIPQTCEHCRMTFIPVKGDPVGRPAAAAGAGAAGGEADAASRCGSVGSSSGSSDGGGSVDGGAVVLEGSLAGGSSLGSASSLAAKHAAAAADDNKNSGKEKDDGPFSPLSQLISNRTAPPSPASVSTDGRSNSSGAYNSNNSGYGRSAARPRFEDGGGGGGGDGGNGGDGSLPQESGFCSGDCKMSYLLTNPAAVRRRRAAAAARAAVRAAQIEDSIERSRRAAAAATVAAADERRKVSAAVSAAAAASKAQRAAAGSAAASSAASKGEQLCSTTSAT